MSIQYYAEVAQLTGIHNNYKFTYFTCKKVLRLYAISIMLVFS